MQTHQVLKTIMWIVGTFQPLERLLFDEAMAAAHGVRRTQNLTQTNSFREFKSQGLSWPTCEKILMRPRCWMLLI
jgi:hypothetical protein